MINKRLLKSRMLLKGASTEDLAAAEGWSKSTAYRKINGSVPFTAKEINVCIKYLDLDLKTAGEIFFPDDLA